MNSNALSGRDANQLTDNCEYKYNFANTFIRILKNGWIDFVHFCSFL